MQDLLRVGGDGRALDEGRNPGAGIQIDSFITGGFMKKQEVLDVLEAVRKSAEYIDDDRYVAVRGIHKHNRIQLQIKMLCDCMEQIVKQTTWYI